VQLKVLAYRSLVSLLAWTLVPTGQMTAQACTRLVYLGTNGDVITARSMDWKSEMPTNLWILPRGIERTGQAGPNSIKWTSKYGSVIASAYDVATSDGVNEKGLEANLLWLVESQYPKLEKDGKPGLTIAAWAQYVLDNFGTVDEAVTALQIEPFTIVTDKVPGEELLATVHLSLSDASGDSAIIEYISGKQTIHHDRKYQVMTNSPIFEQQLALSAYWTQIGGTVMLPGTNRASDRFARAAFYVNAIPKSDNPNRALASVFSVIRNVSVPYGLTTPEEPNISSTRWRTVFDHKRKLYFFESAVTPNTFWIDLKAIDFSSEKGKVSKLDLGQDQDHTYSGDATGQFKETTPFRFLGVNPSK
jgi:penicillin V acylase-like amidase (Ntn superfamily)